MSNIAIVLPSNPTFDTILYQNNWIVYNTLDHVSYWGFANVEQRTLVLGAQKTQPAMVVTMADSSWEKTYEGNFLLLKTYLDAFVPLLAECGGGTVVLMLTLMSLQGASAMANQAFSEAALWGYARQMAIEYGGHNVRINSVVSGYIADSYLETAPENIRQKHLLEIPLGRFGTIDEIAHAVAFLCGRDSLYMTGQALIVDGGVSSSAPLCWRLIGEGFKNS